MRYLLSVKTRTLLAWAGLFVIAASVVSAFSNNLGINLILGIPAYLIIPGMLIQFAFRKEFRLSLNSFVYGAGLTLAYWILAGLAINTLLPLVGISRPLAMIPILGAYLMSMLGLIILTWRKNGTHMQPISISGGQPANKIALLISILLPAMSLVGSNILNNYGGGAVTISMLILLTASLIYVGLNYKKIEISTLPVLIFGLSLALLLMYSMRSWHILGWDINDELRVFLTTLHNQRWNVAAYPGQSYNACLSITILPTIFQQLFHISPEYVFKFLYQVIFAILPVIVYAISRRFTTPILCFFAAVLFSAQTWFYEQMPAIARQEIGLVFFGLIILALVDNALSIKARRILLYLFTVCLVLSHYSTAYIWLIICICAYLITKCFKLFSKGIRVERSYISLVMIVFSVALLYVWEGPLTSTLSHATTVAKTSSGTLAEALSPAVIEVGIQRAFLAPPNINTNANVRAAIQAANQERTGGAQNYYQPSAYSTYKPVAINHNEYAKNFFPGFLSDAIVLLSYLVKSAVVNVLSAIGIVVMLLSIAKKKSANTFEFLALTVASFVSIVLMLVLPYLQENYNLTRLFIQLFTILAVPSVIGLSFILKPLKKYRLPLVAIIVAFIFVSRVGLLDQFTGGELRITMTQPHGTFEYFYVYDSEVDAAKWLAANRNPQTPVYADSIASLRLQSFANIDANNDIFPSSIPRDSYVYLIQANVVQGVGFYSYLNDTLAFTYPNSFLNSNKDLIYASGGSEIYK